jgi:prepilin-type N-terminal cleavage/methylation domain-containing protein
MKLLPIKITRQKGFTLVEIIITLVVTGILGAIFINLLGTALDESWNTVERVRDEADAVGVMEKIIADYVTEMNANPAGALAQIITYNGAGDYGTGVSMQYVEFDAGGNLYAVGSGNTLLVTVPSSGKDIINLLTKSRAATDPAIRY